MGALEPEQEAFSNAVETQNTSVERGWATVWYPESSPSTWMHSLCVNYCLQWACWGHWSMKSDFILDQSREIEMSKSLCSFNGRSCTIFKKTRAVLCWDFFFVSPSHWLLELCRITLESIKIYFCISTFLKTPSL